MSWQFRSRPRTTTRLATIDTYRFPASVRQRVAATHDTLTLTDLTQVESAARQWFRLAARHPRATLAMPSLVTAILWRELSRQTTTYADFCTEAFGRPLPPPPEPAKAPPGAENGSRVGPTATRDAPGSDPKATGPGAGSARLAGPPAALAETFRLAQLDEAAGPTALPLLFRIDQQLAIPRGYRYLADCGGRGICHDLPGTLCLLHAKGTGRLIRGRRRFDPPPPSAGYQGGGGCAGCGGGCGGGP